MLALRVSGIDWPHLPYDLLDELAAEAEKKMPDSSLPHNLQALSLAVIQQTLQDSHGNVSAAARCLGISRQTLYRKITLAKLSTAQPTDIHPIIQKLRIKLLE